MYPGYQLDINDAAYVRAHGIPQVNHKDLATSARAKMKVALTALLTLTPCPHDGTQGIWVASMPFYNDPFFVFKFLFFKKKGGTL